MPMSTKVLMVVPKALVWLSLRLQRTLATQSTNSTVMIGKVGCWKFVKTASLVPRAEDLGDVVALEAALADEEASVGGVVLAAVGALEAASADVVATEVDMVVLLAVALAEAGMQEPAVQLLPQPLILSLTLLLLVGSAVS